MPQENWKTPQFFKREFGVLGPKTNKQLFTAIAEWGVHATVLVGRCLWFGSWFDSVLDDLNNHFGRVGLINAFFGGHILCTFSGRRGRTSCALLRQCVRFSFLISDFLFKCFFNFLFRVLSCKLCCSSSAISTFCRISAAPRREFDFRTSWQMLGSRWTLWASFSLLSRATPNVDPDLDFLIAS